MALGRLRWVGRGLAVANARARPRWSDADASVLPLWSPTHAHGTFRIISRFTFFEIARDRVTHACMDNGPNVFLYSFYDMPVMYNAENRAPRLSPCPPLP